MRRAIVNARLKYPRRWFTLFALSSSSFSVRNMSILPAVTCVSRSFPNPEPMMCLRMLDVPVSDAARRRNLSIHHPISSSTVPPPSSRSTGSCPSRCRSALASNLSARVFASFFDVAFEATHRRRPAGSITCRYQVPRFR